MRRSTTAKVPVKPAAKYDVMIRFQIDWSPVTPEFTQGMRMDLPGEVCSPDTTTSSVRQLASIIRDLGGRADVMRCRGRCV